MQCPKCGWEQSDGLPECRMCGVIFARLAGARQPASHAMPADHGHEDLPPLRHLNRDGWGHLVIGMALAAAALLFRLPLIALDGLRTLFHEFGHALTGWMFGCPGIPAFDLMNGGGVAVIWEQHTGLLGLVYIALGGTFILMRRNLWAIGVLAILTVPYVICAHTRGHEVIYLFMGHGMEMVFAGIFLYRGLSGRSIINPLEPSLYIMTGAFITLRDIGFAWNLVFSPETRMTYRIGKGGMHNDFHRIADDYLHTGIPDVAAVFLLCAALTPILAALTFRYENRLYLLWDELTDRHPLQTG